jgi:L-alanine-DL-glutamate epimerase-like enolase superfamily enzyme
VAEEDAGWVATTSSGSNYHTLIEIETDTGLIGMGSSYTTGRLVQASVDLIRPLLIGQSAAEPERLCGDIQARTFWFGRGGSLMHALSGIDIALWDLLGQITGQPISRLLGGRHRERVKAYASMIFVEPEGIAAAVEPALAAGFQAVKLGWGSFGRVSARHDEALVRAARAAVGDDVALMVDAGGSVEFWSNDARWAIETSKMLGQYDITWFEEPLAPDDLDGYRLLRERAEVRIAGGEVFVGRRSFLPLIERGAVDIIQPDTTKCGGLSEARQIGRYAADHGIGFASHGWSTAVGFGADLHLAAALPNGAWVELQRPSTYIDELLLAPYVLDADGCVAVPDGPGLGIELDREAVDRLARGVGASSSFDQPHQVLGVQR